MGANRGSSFEREVSKILSLWWSQGERDDLIWRTNASGARATQRQKSGKDTRYQFGDLTFTDDKAKPLFERLSMECKTGYSTKTKTGISRWDILDILDSKQKEPVFIKMWKQAMRDAELSRREPVLIFRRNNKAPCIAFKYSLLSIISDDCNSMRHPFFTLFLPNNKTEDQIHIYVMNLSDFLKWTENLPNLWGTTPKDRNNHSSTCLINQEETMGKKPAKKAPKKAPKKAAVTPKKAGK